MPDASEIKRRHATLQGAKTPHESVWNSCYAVTFPSRGSGLQGTQIVSAADSQQQKAQRIYDSTAPDAVKTGAATVMGSMVPSNALWFGLDMGQESDEERRFLDVIAQFIWENIHSSNFDAEDFDAVVDAFVAGWFVLYLDELPDGGFYFETFPIGECSVASTRSGGRVDTLYRLFEYGVGQCVDKYGIDKVSEGTRQKYIAGKIDDTVKILFAIEPRMDYVAGGRMAKNKPFASYHVECDANVTLRESGYDEFPCMVPRWMRIPGSAYATGPMSDALPDVNSLNEVARFTLLGAETAIAPPLKVVDDGVINARNLKIGPRKVIVCAEPDNIQPLITGANIKAGELTSDKLGAKVRKILFADQLPPMDGPVRTATEWSMRVQAVRAVMGPMFGRFEAEWLQPLIERAFGIVWRANIRSGFSLVGRPPQSMLNRSFSIRYLSPLARSQKMVEVDAMDRYEATLGQEAAVDPGVLDVYDWQEAARARAQLLGVPQKLVRDKRTTLAIQQQKAAQAAAQQQDAVQQQGQVALQEAAAKRVAMAA